MDQVHLTKLQLTKLFEKHEDVVITAVNTDAGLIYVEPKKYVGGGKGKWMKANGDYQRDA